ncbi:hypothetical protein [Nonomuraea basaltis]|uniref:hypothetical protein n=1 Tax=Nonomuraea basaltis TaxID=2495887 RepID=UPI00110C4EB9|nr:hypothetical protein [Nonomuraea basaltis]TMR94346.1 hypothetical protein EJK15_34290 [Nonomuraea basaltis]
MSVKVRVAGRLLTAGVLATFGLMMATPARAAAVPDGCWGTGPTVVDPQGQRWPTRYCHNYITGDVYNYVGNGWQPIGKMYAGDNWFVCQAHGPENPPVQSWKNDIWLYTQGDEGWANNGWGAFPATHVSGGVNYGPIPNLDWCPWEDSLPKTSTRAW